jgi:prolyl-tRNA synthetase
LQSAGKLASELKGAGLRVQLDVREEYTPGWKFNDWEMRGVPLRLEVGPRELAEEKVTCARRDVGRRSGRKTLSRAGVRDEVKGLLAEIQQSLLQQATAFLDSHVHEARDYGEFKEIVQDGWAYAWWCGSPDCEASIQEDTKATSRCIPLEQETNEGTCVRCGAKATERAYFARAY